LFVTWDGGGNLPPTLGLARMLAERGHHVRVLSWNTSEERVRAAGCEHAPLLGSISFDPSAGRAWEDQSDEMYERLMCGSEGAHEVRSWIDRDAPDAVVVDQFLASGAVAAEASGLRPVLLTHVQRSFYDFPESDDPENWGWDFDPLNATREELGLEPLSRSDGRIRMQLMTKYPSIVTLPKEFEAPELPAFDLACHAGAVFEDDGAAWDPPPGSSGRTRVLVAFSSTYMHHERQLERVLSALDDLGVQAIVTLGRGLGADEFAAPESALVLPYVPHPALLPHVSLVVTHGGMGTINAALEFGAPMVCMPMGRDQFANAARVVALGCGLSLDAEATVETIRVALSDALGSPTMRDATRRLSAAMRRYERGGLATRELEGMLP